MTERRRRGGRSRTPQGPTAIDQPPFRHHQRPFEPTRVVSDDQLESIHKASLSVLQDTGIDILLPEAQQLFVNAGAKLDGDRVRFDPDMVMEYVAKAPSEFTLEARNPAHSLRIGGNNVVFTSVASPPNSGDIAEGRRTGNYEDFQNFLRLTQHLNAIQMNAGYPVEPADLHASVRHLHAIRDLATLTDKAVHAYSLGADRNRDALEIMRLAHGLSEDEVDDHTIVFSVINTSSPLRIDHPMCTGIIEFASRNQGIVITPFTLAGAMAPVTVVGAVTQQNAEALAGICLTQLVRAGSPVVYGGFTSNVDMKSGAPAFGTPEYMQSAMLGGQLARRYRVPYRSSNVNAANAVDAQAAYESVFSLWGAIMGGANIVLHGAGWLEGGLRASFEKMVLDADLINMVGAFLQPLVVDDATLALEAIADVGPGGHFFGTQHTQDRYRDAFFAPMVSDWRNFESWEEGGSPTADQKLAELYPRLLEEYEQPTMDEARRAEVDAFVDRRIAEGGVATDF
ncbi:MAG: trimethylamine methyltransferase family protein [Acidimicrobiales bacterium]|nr:trimethylamine methyltransferase family protein [Acidimicrobiales bacterium]RZV45652.1 MAG: methyltransferase [Acidimicrobiales bacterium]